MTEGAHIKGEKMPQICPTCGRAMLDTKHGWLCRQSLLEWRFHGGHWQHPQGRHSAPTEELRYLEEYGRPPTRDIDGVEFTCEELERIVALACDVFDEREEEGSLDEGFGDQLPSPTRPAIGSPRRNALRSALAALSERELREVKVINHLGRESFDSETARAHFESFVDGTRAESIEQIAWKLYSESTLAANLVEGWMILGG